MDLLAENTVSFLHFVNIENLKDKIEQNPLRKLNLLLLSKSILIYALLGQKNVGLSI